MNVKLDYERQVGHQYLCHFTTEMAEICLQAHFFKMFGHTKFQLSISYTFKVMRLLVRRVSSSVGQLSVGHFFISCSQLSVGQLVALPH